MLAQAVHHLDDQENHESHDDEIDDRGDEVTKAQIVCDGFPVHHLVPQRQLPFGEAQTADENGDDGHENVVGQGLDEGLERAADDHADGHVKHVALDGELFEFLYKPKTNQPQPK